MNKIRAAVVGYGNIGKYAVEALWKQLPILKSQVLFAVMEPKTNRQNWNHTLLLKI